MKTLLILLAMGLAMFQGSECLAQTVDPKPTSATDPSLQKPVAERPVEEMKIYSLVNARAPEIYQAISGMFVARGLALAVDPRTNSLIARGDPMVLLELNALLARLDQKGSDAAPTAKKPDTGAGRPTSSTPTATLRAQYEAAEQRSLELAAAQRTSNKSSPRGTAQGVPLDQDLRRSVAEALQLRQQLQRAELAEFTDRLERIRQSITIRDRIADQIIDRRVEELLNPDLPWDSIDSTPATNRSLAIESKPTKPATPRRAVQEIRLQITARFQWIDGPGGAMSTGLKTQLVVPLNSTIRIRVNDAQGKYALVQVETAAEHAKTRTYLVHNSVPLNFTDEDFEQIGQGRIVTKVLYLPNELTASGDDAIETVVSTRLDPGADPIAEAQKRGTIVATVRMGTQGSEVFDSKHTPTATKSDSDGTTATPAAHSPDSPPGTLSAGSTPLRTSAGFIDGAGSWDGGILLRSAEEFQRRLASYASRISIIEKELESLRSTQKRGVDSASDTEHQKQLAQTQAELAMYTREYQMAREGFAAQLKLLELELQTAELADQAAKDAWSFAQVRYKAGSAPQSELEEPRRRVTEAAARVQRARILLDLYRKAGANSHQSATPGEAKPQP